MIGAASVIGDVVYVANLKTTETYGFNVANGNKVWSFKDGAYNPVISDGRNIYLTGYKTIYALKPGAAGDQAQGQRRSPEEGREEEAEEGEEEAERQAEVARPA